MAMKVEIPGHYGHTDEELSFIREMGVHYINLNVMPQDATYDAMMRETERLAKYDIYISDFACPPLQKNASIILGKANRLEELEKFKDFVRLAGKIGAPLVSVAWQPNGILRTGRHCGIRGGNTLYVDMKEIESRPILNGRIYSEEEMWDTFRYFLQAVAPVCLENHVQLALHPNDPPVSSLGGVGSLIWNTKGYLRALQLQEASPVLGIKLCVGCWLENPQFGDLLSDISLLQQTGQLVEVHFRNVSAPLPVFEETLSEDGYGDMYTIMKQLVRCGFSGFISVDHSFSGYSSMGAGIGALAYPTGHMKGLLQAAERECMSI